MMATGRINWMSIATWLLLAVCILLAFGFGYVQWNHLTSTRREKAQVDQQIAMQSQKYSEFLRDPRLKLDLLASEQRTMEDSEFLAQLRVLMLNANVQPVQISPCRLTPLPPIEGPINPKDKNVLPSLTNLPFGVRALSNSLTVQGTFPSIFQFLQLVQNYRYQTRAINTNSMQLAGPDEKGNLRANLTVTRFVRPIAPGKSGLSPIGTRSTPEDDGAAKPATGNASLPP